MELSPAISRAIRKYEKVETEGLCLYPITVAEYEEFMTARPAIEFLAQSLPVRYLSMPLLAAYWAMDVDAFTEGKQPVGLFYRVLLFLALSLRLGHGKDMQERVQMVKPSLDADDPRKLRGLIVPGRDGEETLITPVMFYRLRYILAAQNGIELLSDNANPELIQAEREIAQANSVPMDYRLESLISTIAALSGTDEAEMENWPILKLTRQQDAWQRILRFMICGIGEVGGTSWKGGNPHPSPFYDRLREGSDALIPMNEFAGGRGLAAMQAPSATAPVSMPTQTN